MRVAGKAVTALARIDDENAAAGAPKLECCGKARITSSDNDDIIGHGTESLSNHFS